MSGLPERIFFIVRADGTLSQALSSIDEARAHSEISGQPFVEYRFVGREAGAAKAEPSTPHERHSHKEAVVLASMLVFPEAIARATALGVSADDFLSKAHRLLFRSICMVAARGDTVNMHSIGKHLRGEQWLERVGGMAYLAQILDAAREASAFDQCVAEMRSRTRAPAHSVTAQGLLGRLDFVINNVAAPDGRRWSERRWCLAAGLSSATLASFRIRAHNPKSVLEPDSVAMLAHVAGVSTRWLATGEGSHDEAVKP